MNKRDLRAGVTLIEAAIAIMIVAILIGALVPALSSSVQTSRDTATLNQLARIKKGIVGEHRKVPSGEITLLGHGYIGDMGGLPTSLSSLDAAGSLPFFQLNSSLQIGAGWRGPYAPANFTTDVWGQGLVYTVAAGTSAKVLAPTVATITSMGADGKLGTADDHVVEIYKAEAFTDVVGFVKDEFQNPLAGFAVSLSFASGGVIATLNTTTSSTGEFQFSGTPHGTASLAVYPRLTYRRNTAFVKGGANNNVQFVVENISKDPITITSISPSWVTDPTTDFGRLDVIKPVKVTLYNNNAAPLASGSTVAYTFTFAGTNEVRQPVLVDVSGLQMKLPDVVIHAGKAGGTLTIEMDNFQQVGTGTNADMTGVPFSVKFADGSPQGSQAVFTPIQ